MDGGIGVVLICTCTISSCCSKVVLLLHPLGVLVQESRLYNRTGDSSLNFHMPPLRFLHSSSLKSEPIKKVKLSQWRCTTTTSATNTFQCPSLIVNAIGRLAGGKKSGGCLRSLLLRISLQTFPVGLPKLTKTSCHQLYSPSPFPLPTPFTIDLSIPMFSISSSFIVKTCLLLSFNDNTLQ